MIEGDLYIHRDDTYNPSSRLVSIARVGNGEVVVRTFTGNRNSTYGEGEFKREFRVANKKDLVDIMKIVSDTFNSFTSHINDAISQYRDSKSIIDRLKDLARDESIMSREEVLRDHLISIARETPAINIGNSNSVRTIFNALLRRGIDEEVSELRGAVDLSSIREFEELLEDDEPGF